MKPWPQTALSSAAGDGTLDTLRLLVQHGADPNFGLKALHMAMRRDVDDPEQIVVVELLLEHGADVDGMEKEPMPKMMGRKGPWVEATALWEAAKNGDEDMVRLLIERGADVNI